jgi:hypothetical protein
MRIRRSDCIQQSCFISLTLRHRHRLQIARIAVAKEQEWKDKQMHLNANFLQSSRFHRASSLFLPFLYREHFFKYFISIAIKLSTCALEIHIHFILSIEHTLYTV